MLYQHRLSTAALLAGSFELHRPHPPSKHLQDASLCLTLWRPLQPLCGVAQVKPFNLHVGVVQLVLGARLPSCGGRLHCRAEALQVDLQTAEVKVDSWTMGTGVGTVVLTSLTSTVTTAAVVEPAVEFQVDELREAGWAGATLVGLLSGVQTLVGLQVARAAKAFVAHLGREGEQRER